MHTTSLRLPVHIPTPFNTKTSNWGCIGYFTSKNRCYNLSQPKGTAVEAGCWAEVGTDFDCSSGKVWSICCHPSGGWGRDYSGLLLFQGAGWQMQKWGAEQRSRESISPLYHWDFFSTGFRYFCWVYSYLNPLVSFEDFKPASTFKSFSF